MVNLYVRHLVADFAKWKPVYDGHESTRKEFGEKRSEVFTSTTNPNDVLLVFEWESRDRAQEFLETSNLKEVMESAGVVSQPEVKFVD
jgi:quinol monooxygenase YgiN